MIFDYTLSAETGAPHVLMTVEAPTRDQADRFLVWRLLAQGFTTVDLLRWHIVSVVEVSGKP